jgi:hypothetical protein
MAATITYLAVTPTSFRVPSVDTVAVAAQRLAGFCNEMQGLRSAYVDQLDARRWNEQMRELGRLFQALVDEAIADADRHGLEADEDGGTLHAPGFDLYERKAI